MPQTAEVTDLPKHSPERELLLSETSALVARTTTITQMPLDQI